MGVSLSVIVNEIKHHNPEFFCCKETSPPIQCLKLYAKNHLLSESEVLYLGKSSELPDNIAEQNIINILCIEDIPLNYGFLENRQINLIVLKHPADLFSIFNQIQEIMTKHQHNMHKSVRLIELLAHGGGIQHIIDAGYKMLGNPLYALDMSSKVLASTDYIKIEDDLIWNEIVTTGYLSFNTIKMSKEIGRKVDHSQTPLFWKGDFTKYSRIIGKVEIGNKQVGILCVLDYEQPFKESDIELVSLLCNAISLEMQKNKYIHYTRELMYEIFIQDLLEGKIDNRSIAAERVKILGLNFKKYLHVLTIDVNDFDSHGSLPYMREMLTKVIDNDKSVIYNGNIVMVMSCSNEKMPKTTLNNLQEFLKKNNMYGGISRSFCNLDDTQEHYLQSVEALKLGMYMNKEEALFTYDDYAIFHIAKICSSFGDLKKFCHPSLLTLIAFDKLNHTCYTQSLYIFILNLTNVAESANALHIHRNTMLYRLKKIEEITNIDLNDSNTLLHLHLSFKLLEYSKA